MSDAAPKRALTESERVLHFVQSVKDERLLGRILSHEHEGLDGAAVASRIFAARKKAGGITSLEQLLGIPGVNVEAVLRLHAVIIPMFIPIDIGWILQAIRDEWVRKNCTLVKGQTAWQCYQGHIALVDDDVYQCADGSRHTVRRVREMTEQEC